MSLASLRTRSLDVLARLRWLGPLLLRLSLGAVFVQSGWGKLHNLAQVTGYFGELGIPFPAFNAALASTTELVGGTLLVLGLFTRLAAGPLTVTMLVAIATAKRPDIQGSLLNLLAFAETTYVAGFVVLAVGGAGAASLDALLFEGPATARLPRPLLRPGVATLEQR